MRTPSSKSDAAARAVPANASGTPIRDFNDRGSGATRLPSLLGGRVLRYLAEHPGSSGRAVALGLGLRHDSHAWAVLHRFQRNGLLTKKRNGNANAWTLTHEGQRLLASLPEGVYV